MGMHNKEHRSSGQYCINMLKRDEETFHSSIVDCKTKKSCAIKEVKQENVENMKHSMQVPTSEMVQARNRPSKHTNALCC